MKPLLLRDLHADADAARRLVQRARAADVLVGAGDFGNARREIRVCLDVLRHAGRPAVLVAGNNESAEELALLGTAPDAEVAALIGRTEGAVTLRRCRLRIPTFCDRRVHSRRPRGGAEHARP